MDPNETLRRLRKLLGGDHSGDDPTSLDADTALEIICEAEELFQALDLWLLNGQGNLPEVWTRHP